MACCDRVTKAAAPKPADVVVEEAAEFAPVVGGVWDLPELSCATEMPIEAVVAEIVVNGNSANCTCRWRNIR